MVYDPKALYCFTHEVGWIKLSPIVQNSCLLRRAPKLVSTSVWRYVLANPRGIIGLVGRYPHQRPNPRKRLPLAVQPLAPRPSTENPQKL